MTDRLHDPTPTPLPLPEDLGRTANGTPAMPEADVLKAASRLMRVIPSDALLELIAEVFDQSVADAVGKQLLRSGKTHLRLVPIHMALHAIDDALLNAAPPLSSAWTAKLADAFGVSPIQTFVEITHRG